MKHSGLLGRNINYSISPSIHNEYYKDHNINLKYEIFDYDNIEDFIIDIKSKDILGFNVTIPYKEKIIEYLQELEYPANKIKAVNTVLIKEGILIGYNTDYFGFVKSLQNNNINVKNKNALIIGCGGAAKAVFYGLKDLNIKSIHMAVRNKENIIKSQLDIDKILNLNEDIDLRSYDIVINCTPLGGKNYEGISPVNIKFCEENTVFYDLNYTPEITAFMEEGKKYNCKTINGYDMLINQAYKAIEIWVENLI